MEKLKTFLRSTSALMGQAVRYSMPAYAKAEKLEPREWLGLAGHIVAFTIALTSTIGIVNFAMPLAGGSILFTLGVLPVAVFFGFLFQVVIVNALKMAVRSLPARPGVAAACAGVVIVAWALTITASYGSFWNLLSRDSYERRATAVRIEQATEPLEKVSSEFAAATASFAQVSALATRKAARENETGTSCGYAAGTGMGDRWELRMRQQREAKMHSDNLTALNTSLRTSLGKLDSADDAAMATAYRAARETVLAPAVTDATAWVAEQKAGFTRGFSAEGRVFACTDPDMSRQLAKVAKGLGDLPEVNATPPSNVAITNSEGMLLGFARVFGFGDDKLAQDSDFAPIAIPALIELLMTVLILLGEIERPRSGGHFGRVRREIDPDLAGFGRRYADGGGAVRLHEILSDHLVELDRAPSSCFVVPRSPGEPRTRALALLVLCSALRSGRASPSAVLKPFRAMLPFAELPPLAVVGWHWHDEHCDLHLLPRATAERVRRMITKQAEAELFEDLAK